jgi:hypothetical protein
MKRHLGKEGRALELEEIKKSCQEERPNDLAQNLSTAGLRRKYPEDSIWRY